MPHYDLAIIGSGSGNSLITPFWDDRKVAMIDGGVFGGTCLNVGCIPTKMFVYPASLAAAPGEAARLGVDLSLDKVRWNELRDGIFGRIDAIWSLPPVQDLRSPMCRGSACPRCTLRTR